MKTNIKVKKISTLLSNQFKTLQHKKQFTNVFDNRLWRKIQSGFNVQGLYMIILAVSVAGAAYWWRDKKADEIEKTSDIYASSLRQSIVKLNAQLSDERLKNNFANVAVCGEYLGAPIDSTINNIKSSINSGNTAALVGYMAESVSILQVESGVITNNNPSEAVAEMSNFISNNSSFWDYNFSLPASIISSYGAGAYGKYFPNGALVGKSGDKRVMSFVFDCKNKISVILVAYNENLLQ